MNVSTPSSCSYIERICQARSLYYPIKNQNREYVYSEVISHSFSAAAFIALFAINLLALIGLNIPQLKWMSLGLAGGSLAFSLMGKRWSAESQHFMTKCSGLTRDILDAIPLCIFSAMALCDINPTELMSYEILGVQLASALLFYGASPLTVRHSSPNLLQKENSNHSKQKQADKEHKAEPSPKSPDRSWAPLALANPHSHYITYNTSGVINDYANNIPFFTKMKHKLKDDEILDELNRSGNIEQLSVTKENITFPSVKVPNTEALRELAARYGRRYQKYRVAIQVIFFDKIQETIEQLMKDPDPDPKYVGIIIEMAAPGQGLHVVPLLCFIGGTSRIWKREFEYLFMDILGGSDTSHVKKIGSELLKLGIERDKIIYYKGSPRQSDPVSCRVGAIELLCNAILMLNFYKFTDGFARALKIQTFKSEKSVTQLPPQWVVYEQIMSKDIDLDVLHIRDLIKKNLNPRVVRAPRTVRQIRESYKEEAEIHHRFRSDRIPHLPIIVHSPWVRRNIEGVNYLQYSERTKINNYLYRISERQAKRIAERAAIPNVSEKPDLGLAKASGFIEHKEEAPLR